MPPKDSGMKRRTRIHIGGLHASREPAIIETVLGSCVAVCLYDPVERIGGMNHILLPGRADLSNFDSVSRYGINAMELLINRIMALGSTRSPLVAKVFGGAHMLSSFSQRNGMGLRNAAFVLDFLRMESISVVGQDLGGYDTRRITFHTDTGEVLLKRIPPLSSPRIDLEERKYLNQVRREARKSGDVVLFT
jgi:chemotaxis protein CheD